MNKPMISVIVPVYNAEKYLQRCVDSILKQSFTDFEVLLIDDGSHDRPGELCDEYGDKDNRVRVFHKENGGVSSARNVGLDNALGDWLAFVDSDDEITSSYLSSMVSYIDDDVSLIVSNCTIVKCGKYYKSHVTMINETISTNEMLVKLLNGVNIRNEVWAKLFKRSFVGKERFPSDIRIGEDLLFLISCCYNSPKMNALFLSNTEYHYFQYEVSAMRIRTDRTTEYEKLIKEVMFRLKNFNDEKAKAQFVIDQIWIILDKYCFKKIQFPSKYDSLIDNSLGKISINSEEKRILWVYTKNKLIAFSLYLVYKIKYKIKNGI